MSRAGPVARPARFSVLEVTVILVLHEETSMITKRLEAVGMRIVLSALLLLVWFPGLARRA